VNTGGDLPHHGGHRARCLGDAVPHIGDAAVEAQEALLQRGKGGLAGLVLVQDGAGDVREGVVAGGEGCRGGGPGLLLLRCREGGGGLCGFVSGGGDLVECRRHSQKLAERRAARIGGEVEAIHQPTELRRGGGHGHIEGGEHIRHLGGHSGELFLFGVEKVVVPRGGGGEVLHATHR